MKKCQSDENPLVDFHVVIRVIPETNAYSVTIGEIQDGQFAQTSRRPECCSCDWVMVRPNPLASNQSYVLAADLHDLISEILVYSSDVMLYPNMLVFVINDYPCQFVINDYTCRDESTQEKDEE